MFKHNFSTCLVLFFSLVLNSCQDIDTFDSPLDSNQNIENSFSKAIVTNYEEIEFYDLILSGECLGEDLHFYGTFSKKVHVVVNANGNFHSVIRWIPLDMSVTGVTSGRTWRMIYNEVEIQRAGKVGIIYHDSGHGMYMGNQPGPNLMEHWVFHLTVNANGEVTATKETVRIECHGN